MAVYVAFFFGSGISFASGAPSVGGITDALLNGDWIAHTDGRFYPRPSGYTGAGGDAERAQEFLRRVKKQIDPHLRDREGREAHYEDLFAAVRQIVQDETVELTNPMIAGTVAAIRNTTLDLVAEQRAHIDENTFASVADRASDLIQWCVASGLRRVQQPSGLHVIAELAKQSIRSFGALDIFSLNHDCLIEAQLAADKVRLNDGFGNLDGDACFFDGWTQTAPVRLFKLHGSIDWYRFRHSDRDQYARVSVNVDHARDAAGNRLVLLQPTPLFLTGTAVKEQAYGHGLVGDVFYGFRKYLSHHRTLICCGYGWSDKGINIRLDEWLRRSKENRIVLLHPRAEEEIAVSRFWAPRREVFRKTNKLVIIPKWLSDCTVADLAPYTER